MNKGLLSASGQRRFYVAEYCSTAHPLDDYKWLNLRDVVPGLGMPRTTRIETPYTRRPFFCGLPVLQGRPRVAVGLKSKEPLDAYMPGGTKIISSRAKVLLEAIDPEAFEFSECDTETRRDRNVEDCWLCSVKRVVNEFDEENSNFKTNSHLRPDHQARHDIHEMYEFKIPDLPEDIHAFYLSRFPRRMIFDDAIVDAWVSHGLTGMSFTPLQEPTDEEFKHRMEWLGANTVHWARERGLIK